MRALVTGASGFVGRYLVDALRGDGYDVLACGGPNDAVRGDETYFAVDLADAASVAAAFERGRPDVVFHLAARTFVPDSFESPVATYEVNAIGSARVAAAARDYAAGAAVRVPRLVFVSSAEVYGKRDAGEFPLDEALELRPATPYAASKAAAEAMLLSEARSLGSDVVVARAFNHVGPGQSERFVVAAFAAQLARIASGAPPLLMVGNLDAARDFLDVRDVVRAYLALAREGESGAVYNVCSGTAVKIRDVLRELVTIARVPVEIREDPARMRPVDVPVFLGSARRIAERTGWRPEIPLARSLRDIYAAALEDAGKGAPAS